MRLFRTKNGFIFQDSESLYSCYLHKKFKYSTTASRDVTDEIVAIGTDLKQLIQINDLIEYDLIGSNNNHGAWLIAIKTEEDRNYVINNNSVIVKRIYVNYIESCVLPYTYTLKNFWTLGDKK